MGHGRFESHGDGRGEPTLINCMHFSPEKRYSLHSVTQIYIVLISNKQEDIWNVIFFTKF